MHDNAPTLPNPLAPTAPSGAASANPVQPEVTRRFTMTARSLPREHGFEPLSIEGSLPDDLRGSLYRNGPSLAELFGHRYTHSFEGDGAITAVRFDGGNARGACRVIESAGLRAERAAGRVLFGSGLDWPHRFWKSLTGQATKNTANTSVMVWQNRLFALMEAGKPTEIDPHDLRTLGETDLGGAVISVFTAHPHRVTSRRTTYSFGVEYGRYNRLHLYALPDQGAARHLGALDLPGPPLLHDFMCTDSHMIFFVSPARVNVPRVLLQVGDFEKFFRWQPNLGTEVICVPIDRPNQPLRFSVDSFFQWHFVNAFERGRTLVADYIRYPDFSSFNALAWKSSYSQSATSTDPRGYYHRAEIDLDSGRMRSEQRFDCPCEMPRVSPGVEGLAHRFAWVTRDVNAIARFDLETGAVVTHRLPAGHRASEPVFVKRRVDGKHVRDEADGHVLVLCHDSQTDRSFLAIYDAQRLDAGPRARVWFDHYIPATFHGSWIDA